MLKNFKLKASAFLLGSALVGTALVFGNTAEAAGDGTWTKVGSEMVYAGQHSSTYYSAGGSFKVCINPNDGGGNFTFSLNEADPNWGDANDDPLGIRYVNATNRCAVWDNINNFVDGSNNRAELYLTVPGGRNVMLDFYD